MFNRQKKFSIRKLSIGVASVVIASVLHSVSVQAEEPAPMFRELEEDVDDYDDYIEPSFVELSDDIKFESTVKEEKQGSGVSAELTVSTEFDEFQTTTSVFKETSTGAETPLTETKTERENALDSLRSGFMGIGIASKDVARMSDEELLNYEAVADSVRVDFNTGLVEWNDDFSKIYSTIPIEASGANLVEIERRRRYEIMANGRSNSYTHPITGWTFNRKHLEEVAKVPYKFFETDPNVYEPPGSASVFIGIPFEESNSSSFASAIQIGSNTYLTAAHLFLDNNGALKYLEGNSIPIIHKFSKTFNFLDGKTIIEEERNKGHIIDVPLKLNPRKGESGISFFNFADYEGVSPTDVAVITVAEPVEFSQGAKQIPRLLGEDAIVPVGEYLTWSGYPSYNKTEDEGNGYYIGTRKTVRQKVGGHMFNDKPVYLMHAKSAGGASGSGVWDESGKVRAVLNGSWTNSKENYPDLFSDTLSMHAMIHGKSHEWVRGLLAKHDHMNEWYEREGKRYYFDEERKLVRDKTVVIEGKRERFGSDGAWIETLPAVTRTEEVDIPFDILTEDNPDMKAGERRLKQNGEKGRKRLTYENDVLTDETVIKQPKPEITYVGTGIETTEIVEIQFNVVEQQDPTIKMGERRVETPGRKGRKEVTKLNNRVTNERVLEPAQDEIVKVGTGVEITEIEEIPFNTVNQNDNTIKQGERRVVQQGRKGRKEVTKFNGHVTNERVLEPAQDEIVKIGTGIEEVETVEIDFKVVEENDATILTGERKTERQGRKGRKEITKFNGAVTNERILENPVDELVKVGTGVETMEVVEFDFNVIETEDPNIPRGERVVTQHGVKGTKEVYSFNGKVTREVELTPAIDEEVRVGMGDLRSETVKIPFKEVRIDDDTIPVGEERVETEGVEGEKVITYINGEKTSEVVKTNPVDKVIRVGTQVTEYEEVDIPFNTVTVQDADLEKGKTEIRQNGVVGRKRITKVNGVVSGEEIITAPQDEIIAEGIKEPEVIDSGSGDGSDNGSSDNGSSGSDNGSNGSDNGANDNGVVDGGSDNGSNDNGNGSDNGVIEGGSSDNGSNGVDSGSNDNGNGSTDSDNGSSDNGSGSSDGGLVDSGSDNGSTDNGNGSTDNGSGATDNGSGATDNGSGATDNGSGSTGNGTPEGNSGSTSDNGENAPKPNEPADNNFGNAGNSDNTVPDNNKPNNTGNKPRPNDKNKGENKPSKDSNQNKGISPKPKTDLNGQKQKGENNPPISKNKDEQSNQNKPSISENTGDVETENNELNRSEVKTTGVSDSLANEGTLPETGEYDVFIPAVMSLITSVGLAGSVVKSKKED